MHGLLLLEAAAGPRGGRPAWLLLPMPSPSTSQSVCAGTPRRVACVLGVVGLPAVAVLLLVHVEEARLVVGPLQHQHPATPAHDRLVRDGWSQLGLHLKSFDPEKRTLDPPKERVTLLRSGKALLGSRKAVYLRPM